MVVLVVTAAKTVRVRTEERMRGIFYLERRSLELGRGPSRGDVVLLFFALLGRGRKTRWTVARCVYGNNWRRSVRGVFTCLDMTWKG